MREEWVPLPLLILQPRLMNLKEVLVAFIAFREEVIRRRTIFELGKARERAHVLAGLAVAVANIDDVIALIRAASDPATARERLMTRDWPAVDVAPMIELLDEPGHTVVDGKYKLSEAQARAILELRLHRLTGLERDKIGDDLKKLGVEIEDVRIMRLDLPEEVSESVYERMRSERQEVIRTLRAQGDAAAQEIRSDAERERTIILADAYSQGQVIRGEGDARAAELYANAYQANPTFYSFYRSLQLYRDALGSDDLMLLRPDGQLFRYFNPSASNAASSP